MAMLCIYVTAAEEIGFSEISILSEIEDEKMRGPYRNESSRDEPKFLLDHIDPSLPLRTSES